MATGTGKVLCRYFMSGCCKNGLQCPFSHEWTDKPDTTCRYYLKGSCLYGDKCRYDHVKPKTVTESKKSLGAPVSLPSASSAQSFTQSEQSFNKMVPLVKDPSRNPKKWAKAATFVPGQVFHGESSDLSTKEASEGVQPELPQFSYSEMASGGVTDPTFLDVITSEEAASLLCPFAEMGHCPFGDSCEYLHGEACDMCNRQCLNPLDPEQQKAHRRECLEMHEREMERAFDLQETEGKKCAICLELVSTKPVKSDQRFGILPNCDHCFCLGCIRKWRQTTHAQKRTIRACPLCRTVSYFVIPSDVWIESGQRKDKLIGAYKGNLSDKHCKHFNRGLGTCSFGGSCFYKHVYPDGTVAREEPRFTTDADGEKKPIRNNTLWDFLNDREERHVPAELSSGSSYGDDLPEHILSVMLENNVDWWSDQDNDFI